MKSSHGRKLPGRVGSPSRARRSFQRGQGVTEFALAVPVFVALLWGCINGGLLLFSHGQVEHAADVGMVALAAEGNYDNPADPVPNNADAVALGRMAAAGLGQGRLVSVSEIAVIHEIQQGDGQLADDPNEQNRYGATGNPLEQTWMPGSRVVVSGQTDFVKLRITYRYSFFGQAVAPLTMTSVKTFRLEPQSS